MGGHKGDRSENTLKLQQVEMRVLGQRGNKPKCEKFREQWMRGNKFGDCWGWPRRSRGGRTCDRVRPENTMTRWIVTGAGGTKSRR